jgi:hypothetical protein
MSIPDPIPASVTVTFSGVSEDLDGDWVLNGDYDDGYPDSSIYAYESLPHIRIAYDATGGPFVVGIIDGNTIFSGDGSGGEEWQTDFTNDPVYGEGTAHVSFGGPPKAVNPAPATASTGINLSLDILSWEIPG